MGEVVVLAALDPGAVQLVLGLFGLSGFGGLLLAIRKFGPETNEIAVGSMEKSNASLERERDYWKAEALAERGRREECEKKLEAYEDA